MHLLSSLSWLAVGASAVSLDHASNSKVARSPPTWGTDTASNVPPKAVGYFGNWDIYGAKYYVTDIPASQLTHLAYAFANVDNKTGEV
ncbi:hypothetical protein E4U53_007628 [Claviceps sorghi]|nr:hypothetical protein E4U53_007628 [Claviceps sorghi]